MIQCNLQCWRGSISEYREVYMYVTCKWRNVDHKGSRISIFLCDAGTVAVTPEDILTDLDQEVGATRGGIGEGKECTCSSVQQICVCMNIRWNGDLGTGGMGTWGWVEWVLGDGWNGDLGMGTWVEIYRVVTMDTTL